MNNVRVTICILTFVLLDGFASRGESKVSITTPPENTTVCRSSDVTISCGYDSDTPLDPVWRINRTIFLQPSQIRIISSYQENNPTTPVNYSLTIFSINGTTEIRCSIASQSLNVTTAISPDVIITVIDQPHVEIITETGGCGYVYVSWNVTNNIELCKVVQYNVTLSSSTVNMIIPNVAVDSYNFTGLSLDTLFTITVIGISKTGNVVNSDSTSIRTETTSINCSSNTGGSDSDSGGSSTGAIAGGVIGGIVVVIIIVIIIIVVIYCFVVYKKKDSSSSYGDTTNLKSSTSTGGSHVSAAKTNGNTDSNGHSDKVLYAAPAKTATIPHHTAAGGQEYAVSTKATNKTSQAQPPSEHYDDVQGTKKDAQGITYAELQLSTELKGRDPTNHDTAVTYSQIA